VIWITLVDGIIVTFWLIFKKHIKPFDIPSRIWVCHSSITNLANASLGKVGDCIKVSGFIEVLNTRFWIKVGVVKHTHSRTELIKHRTGGGHRWCVSMSQGLLSCNLCSREQTLTKGILVKNTLTEYPTSEVGLNGCFATIYDSGKDRQLLKRITRNSSDQAGNRGVTNVSSTRRMINWHAISQVIQANKVIGVVLAPLFCNLPITNHLGHIDIWIHFCG